MPPLTCWRDGDGDRRTALGTAPNLGVFGKATCQPFAAILRKHVEIADLAKATPFDIEHGRNGDNGLRCLAVNRKRAPTEGVGEHSIEILRDARKRRGEFFLAEEPRQQFQIAVSLVLTVTIWISLGKLYPAENMTGLPGAWSAEAEMRAGNWGFDLGFVGDRKFDTKGARRSTIIGAAALSEVDNAYKPERAQSGVIETTTTV